VSLHVEVAGDPRVRGDRGELYRMILNLVHNAIVHGSPSGGRVRIALLEGAPRGVELVVDDDGRGFPASMLGGGARSPEWRGGHGLGLAIAWAIAHRHGAQLVIENRGEGGGRARVSFEEVSR
jgi:signal transduction histidine kinase